MTIADEVRAAAQTLREDLPVPWELVKPLATLLEYVGDDMAEADAYEKFVGSLLFVFTPGSGETRHDWTAALATARVILRSGT